jgi:ubiquinone/menaquinone biosynthesis C-methylase UbiE
VGDFPDGRIGRLGTDEDRAANFTKEAIVQMAGNRNRQTGRRVIRAAFLGVSVVAALSATATLIAYPWGTDPQGDETSRTRSYYGTTYAAVAGAPNAAPASTTVQPLSKEEEYYVQYARESAAKANIRSKIERFVQNHGLQDKKVLEVGAGSGLLQDIVSDYTGLDISPTARRFFHKPFVEASATEMPFADNTFDALWSVWVLEHIPNPEKALAEMRRVLKPGGYIYLHPAFDVTWYAAQGYAVRPYSDLGVPGKLAKAVIPFTRSSAWHYLQHHQARAARYLQERLRPGPSRLHFTRLTPNYDQYWVADSDAAVSISRYDLYLWFTSRGDHCLGCPSESQLVLRDVSVDSYTIQVMKP